VATLREGAPGSVEKLGPSGAALKTLYTGGPEALALDAAGDLYLGDKRDYHFLRLDPAGELKSVFGAGQAITNSFGEGPRGNALALDEASGALYAASGRSGEASAVQRFELPEPGPLPDNQQATDLLPTSATLAATLNPEGQETSYRFEYDTSPYEEGEAGHGTAVPVPDATLPAGFEDEPVQAHLEGLIPDTTYHFRLVATNECEPAQECTVEGPDTTFTTRPAVAIEAQWAAAVAARSATLHAELDPLGPPAEWWIEYGTSPCSEGGCAKTAKAALPAGFGEVPLATALTGLEPATTYHYRFVAEDEREGEAYEVPGEPRAFTTQPGALGFSLPDERAWEMVSPPDKHGGAIRLGYGEGQIQAAANGEAAAYLSAGSIEAAPQGNRMPDRSSVLSRRGPGGRWSSEDITTPSATVRPNSIGLGFEYKLFSADLSGALVEPRTETPLSADASERTPYLRSNAEPPTFTPLLSGCPDPPEPCPPAVEEHADVPPGTEFGTNPAFDDVPLVTSSSAARIEGATPDLAHVVLRSAAPLAAGVAGQGLYEWSAGSPPAQRLRPLSVLPEGGAVVDGELGSHEVSVRNAISAGGSRVFWTAVSGANTAGLYLRDNATEAQSALDGSGECAEPAKACTIRLDALQPGAFGTGNAAPVFQGANTEGTVAFFTDTQNLTADANEAGADLYRCEVVVEAGEPKCALSDLTAHTLNPADPFEGAEVQGLAAGIGEDGSRVYFVARGVLAGANAEERSPAPREPNLYLWQQGAGTRFIATLAGEEDFHDWGGRFADSGAVFAIEQSAAASPSGRYLAFMSALPLTGYDNRDAISGEADQEVFRYDALGNGGEGGLICASCNPSGARPAGLRGYQTPGGAPFYDFQELWWSAGGGGRPLAAVLPDATRTGVSNTSLYRPRAVHDDGRLFFNAADALVGADANGTWDVYQYEPSATGSCSASSGDAGTARAVGGCVSLISSGSADEEAGFLDASQGGSDVFFFSSARLSVTDVDRVTDVYDARTGGEPATLSPRAECLGEACQPPATAPAAPTPASAAFNGPGNVREASQGRRCPKGKRKVRRKGKARCVKKHHHHAVKKRHHHAKHRHGRSS
jgi:hypothetical protein